MNTSVAHEYKSSYINWYACFKYTHTHTHTHTHIHTHTYAHTHTYTHTDDPHCDRRGLGLKIFFVGTFTMKVFHSIS